MPYVSPTAWRGGLPLALAAALVLAACGGGVSGELALTKAQAAAAAEAEQYLATALDQETSRVALVEFDGFRSWRVEVETSEGHRCVYMDGDARPDHGDSLGLISIKGGSSCQGPVLWSYIENG